MISSALLDLRRLTAERLDGLGGIMESTDARSFFGLPDELTVEALQAWFSDYVVKRALGQEHLYVFYKEGLPVGLAGVLFPGGRSTPRIGYVYFYVAPEWRKQGLGSSALNALIDRATAELNCVELRAIARSSNEASRRVLSKNRFREYRNPGGRGSKTRHSRSELIGYTYDDARALSAAS